MAGRLGRTAGLAASLACAVFWAGGCKNLVGVRATLLDEPTVLERQVLGSRAEVERGAALLPLGRTARSEAEREQLAELAQSLNRQWEQLAAVESPTAETRMWQAAALHDRAVLTARLGRREDAEKALEEAIAHCRAYGLETMRWQTMQVLGELRGGEAGYALYLRAAEVLADAPLLSALDYEIEDVDRRRRLYAHLVAVSMLKQDPEAALEHALWRRAVELARASAPETIRFAPGPLGAMAADLAEARRKMADVRQEICALPRKKLDEADDKAEGDVVALRRRRQEAMAALTAAREALGGAPAAGGLLVPAPADIAEVREVLFQDTALLMLEPCGQGRFAAFVVTPEEFSARTVRLTAQTIAGARDADEDGLAAFAKAVLGPFEALVDEPRKRLYIVCPDALSDLNWDAAPLFDASLGERLQMAFLGDPSDLSAAFAAKSYGRNSTVVVQGWPGTEAFVPALRDAGVAVVDAGMLDAPALARQAAHPDLLWLSNAVVLDAAEPGRSYVAVRPGQGRLGGLDVGAMTALGSRAGCAGLASFIEGPWRPTDQTALRVVCRALAAGGIPSVIGAAAGTPPEVSRAYWDACLPALRSWPAGAAHQLALRSVPKQFRRAFRLRGYLGMDQAEFAEYVAREYADREAAAARALKSGRLADAAAALMDLQYMVTALEEKEPAQTQKRAADIQRWLVHCWNQLRRYDRAARHQEQLVGLLAVVKDYPGRALGLEYLSLGALLTQAERYEDAVTAYRQALAGLGEHGRSTDVPEALGELGKSLDRATQYEQALQTFELAMENYRRMEDESGVAQQLQRIGALYLKRLDKPRRAEDYFGKALEIYQRRKDRVETIDTGIDIALCRRRIGDMEDALRRLNAALDAARAARPEETEALEAAARGLAAARETQAEARRRLQNAELALEAAENSGLGEEDIQQAATLAQERRAPAAQAAEAVLRLENENALRARRLKRLAAQEARALGQLGNTLWLQGKYQAAFGAVGESNEIAARLDSAFQLNVNHQLLALIYWELNDFSRAHSALDEAVRQARLAEMPLELASAHNNRGIIFRRQKQYEQALASFDEALKIDERLRSRWGQGYDQRNIGITLHRMGHLERAGRRLGAAVQISGEIGDAVNLTRALYALGDLRSGQERFEDADRLLKQALESARKVYMPEVEWRALRALGLLRQRKGDRTGAIELLGEAVKVVESVREELKVEEFRSGFLTNKMDLYEDIVGLLLDSDRPEDALGYAERSRSRNFLDVLARQSFELKTDLEKRLYAQQSALGRAIRSLKAAVHREKDPERREALAKDLDTRHREFADVLIRIRAANPQLAGFVSVEVAEVDELARAIGDGATLVVYYVMKDEVAIWILRDGKLSLRRVKVDRERLTARVRDYRLMIQRRDPLDEVRAASQELYESLVAPVVDIVRGSRVVGIVPHRGLHYLSFAGLYDGEEFLVERYPIFYAPSASVLARALQRPGAAAAVTAPERRRLKVLAVGNPDVGEPAYALPFSEKEVRSLERDFVDVTLLERKEATEEWVTGHIGEFDVIHLAAHAYFDSVNPLFSALMLAPDPERKDDGTLELHEVSGLEIKARLVMLSACQSALGDLRAGDELVSLGRTFMYAGTQAVISTLWRVDDVATALLSKHFYRQYAGRWPAADDAVPNGLEPPGLAVSLQRAQLRVMNDGRHYHPVYWAGMVLTGDYR